MKSLLTPSASLKLATLRERCFPIKLATLNIQITLLELLLKLK